jgi:hypothetical protein
MQQDMFWQNTYDNLNLELARRALKREGISNLLNFEIFKQFVNDHLTDVFDIGPRVLLFQYRDNSFITIESDQIS